MDAFAFPERTVIVESASTTAQFVPYTRWMPAAGSLDVKAVLKMRDVVNDDVQAKPGLPDGGH